MKRFFTLLKTSLPAFFLLTIISVKGFSQPDYIFKNSVLESGVDKEVGAIYRFPQVKTGVDALVSINFISTDVKVHDFDDNKNGGFDEAFQPRISAKGNTNGYAEFTITFVAQGTSKIIQMTEVPATSIDVDGNKSAKDSMFEFDEYMIPGAYQLDYDMVATDLKFKFTAGSVTGKNTKGLEKALIDTLAMEAMFSVVYPNTSSITVRIGLDNQLSSTTIRQRSVYFKRFFFQNSFLPISNLLSFSANRNTNNEVVLNWRMSNEHEYAVTSVEKSTNGISFSSIGQVPVTGKTSMLYTDNAKIAGGSYYRLKMTDKNGKIGYSAILFVRSVNNNSTGKVTVFPSIVNDNTNISFPADRDGNVKISVFDQSGRLMMKRDANAQSGTNTIALTGLSQLAMGQYIVVVSADGHNYSQKILRSN